MRIAIVIEKYDPQGGGAERSTSQIVGELARRGHDITVLAANSGGALVADFSQEQLRAGVEVKTPDGLGYSVRVLGGRLHSAGMRAFAAWAKQQQRDGKFDSSLSVTTAVPAAVVQPRSGTVRETLDRNIAMRRRGFPRLLKRLLVALTPKQRTLLALERATLRALAPGVPEDGVAVRKIAAVSDYVAEQLHRHYGITPNFIEVIPNAAEVPTVDPAQRLEWRKNVRSAFQIGERDVVFVFAALNPKLKGARTLLEATALLKARGVPVTVILAGETSWWLQSTSEQLGVRACVRLVGPTREMGKLYCAADVTVLPTFYDPSSKVVIESLMMGVPAISTAFNGASDFLRATATTAARGRVINDPGDSVELADAMQAMVDEAERTRCAAACAGLAEELSMRRHVDRLESLLRALS